MKRKKIIALFVCMIVFFIGCGKTEEAEQVELTFIHGWGGTVKTHAIMQRIYEEFEVENPDIILKFQPSSDSSIAVEKANDLLAADKMPEIISTNGQSYYVQNAIKRNMALNLMPYIERDKEFESCIHPAVLESWIMSEGELYTIPDAMEVMGYWYNAAYFEEAGIDKVPQTWEEFYAACEKLQALSKKVYALEKVQTVENLFLARLAGTGEEGLLMTEGIPEEFDTLAFRRTVKEFEKIFSYAEEAESLDDARAYFKDGKTAMYFNGVWESEELEDGKCASDIAYANYPTESGKSLAYISPSSGYVLADSMDEKKKEAGIRFLKYILNEEVQLRIALETGQTPSNPNVNTQKIIEEYPMLGKALEEAYGAEIQIKTISSVWNSNLIDTLEKDLENACESEEGIERLIRNMRQNIK